MSKPPLIVVPTQVVIQANYAVDQNGNVLPVNAGNSEAVAASQTDQVLGSTGAIGDFLSSMLVTPATTSPGAISIKDGSGGSVTVFAGGASSVPNLIPFTIQIGAKSTSGAWKVTTGANVSLVATGSFT